MAESFPPPIYSQQDPVDSPQPGGDSSAEPQILFVPTADAVNFQNGFLGAEGERATIEGELQVKGVDPTRWNRV